MNIFKILFTRKVSAEVLEVKELEKQLPTVLEFGFGQPVDKSGVKRYYHQTEDRGGYPRHLGPPYGSTKPF